MPSLMVKVIRYDGKLITDMSMDTFMSLLTKKLLDAMPDQRRKLFMTQDLRDEQISMALREAWLSLRTDLFAVGFKLSTWVDE
jgi:hypothetical protein